MKKLPKKKQQKIDLETFRSKLKLKSFQERNNLIKRHPHAVKFLGATALAGTLLLSPMTVSTIPSHDNVVVDGKNMVLTPEDTHAILASDLRNLLPPKTKPLTTDQEKQLSTIFNNVIHIKAVGTLEGEHLNTTYGLIGAEQHLRRYPGDTIANHNPTSPYDEGMAPGLGAWGYFASSKEKLTPDLVEDEKWYVAVQTLYLPDWTKRLAYLRDWYKYRKVLVVNTLNGNAVVADVGDSGPANWTGKSFGGSPEVMESLGGEKYKVGPVLLFFVDDPNNQVPLGPVSYN